MPGLCVHAAKNAVEHGPFSVTLRLGSGAVLLGAGVEGMDSKKKWSNQLAEPSL